METQQKGQYNNNEYLIKVFKRNKRYLPYIEEYYNDIRNATSKLKEYYDKCEEGDCLELQQYKPSHFKILLSICKWGNIPFNKAIEYSNIKDKSLFETLKNPQAIHPKEFGNNKEIYEWEPTEKLSFSHSPYIGQKIRIGPDFSVKIITVEEKDRNNGKVIVQFSDGTKEKFTYYVPETGERRILDHIFKDFSGNEENLSKENIEDINQICICIDDELEQKYNSKNNGYSQGTFTDLTKEGEAVVTSVLSGDKELNGIELYPIKPKSISCKTIKDTHLTYAHGIIGALSQEQVRKYCSSETEIENKKISQIHRKFSNAVKLCKTEVINLTGAEKVKSYIKCMSDQLSTKKETKKSTSK